MTQELALSVREITADDVSKIVNYWMNADADYLDRMGADIAKMPSPEAMTAMLQEQLTCDYSEKKSYALIWLHNEIPIGHCNINMIQYGERANMHLHLWSKERRMKGMGVELVKMSLPYFFKNMQLKELYCEPYALNDAPNKTLAKAGFQFVKKYVTIPGSLNFEQEVNQWKFRTEMLSKIE